MSDDVVNEQGTSVTPAVVPSLLKKAKAKQRSRADRWAEAVANAQTALQEARDAHERLVEKVAEIREIQEEFETWKDNLPENLQQSALGERLEEVCGIDLDVDESTGLDEIEERIGEYDGVVLPLGFGRD